MQDSKNTQVDSKGKIIYDHVVMLPECPFRYRVRTTSNVL